jgi:hypothetical protein
MSKIYIAISVDDEWVINNKIIDEKVFEEELVDYRFEVREDTIDNLIMWINEARSENDKILMKEDLKQLMNLDEKYVLSSISTNEYLSQAEDAEKFREVCLEILEENGPNPKRTNDSDKPNTLK